MKNRYYARTKQGIIQADEKTNETYNKYEKHTQLGLMKLLEEGDYYNNKKIECLFYDYDEDTGWDRFAKLENNEYISKRNIDLNKIKTKEQIGC